jgi:hypothetical protein
MHDGHERSRACGEGQAARGQFEKPNVRNRHWSIHPETGLDLEHPIVLVELEQHATGSAPLKAEM